MTVKHAANANTDTEIFNMGPDAIQPNGVDLRLDKVLRVKPTVFVIDANNNKTHRETELIEPDEDGFYFLEPGVYEITCLESVKVGTNECGLVINRSSFNRNSVIIRGSVFDDGYHGAIALSMYVNVAPIKIQRGTRIAQYVTFAAESACKYEGSYGFGTADDQKYGTKA